MAASQVRPNTIPNTSLADGTIVDQFAGRAGEEMIAQLHGKYYTQTYRGNVFHATTAATGAVLPIYSGAGGTTYTVALWNPLGSAKNLVPIKASVGYVSGTLAAGNIVYAYARGIGTVNPATGGTLSTFTSIAPVNANLGSGIASSVKFAGAAGAIVVVSGVSSGTFLKTSGMSHFVPTGGGTAQTQWTATEDFDGTLIIPPDTLFFVGGNIAILGTFSVGLTWAEVPV